MVTAPPCAFWENTSEATQDRRSGSDRTTARSSNAGRAKTFQGCLLRTVHRPQKNPPA
jgi:hypothetical protein